MSELIAEARVLVTPDTTAFRTLLVTQVAAASKGVTVPVAVTPVAAGGARVAAQIAGAQASATKVLASSTTAAAQATGLLLRAEAAVVAAEKRATVAATEVSAARIRYAASLRATTLALQAEAKALTTTDPLLLKVTRDSLAAARANEALALSSLEAARAESVKTSALTRGASAQAAQLSQVSRGAGGAALSLLGLRGATLAATGPFLAGAAAFAVFAKSVGASTNLETSLNVFRVTAEATGDQMERIGEVARELGADLTLPGVNAQDAADALAQLSRAGLDVENSIAGVRGVLQLATAAAIDNEQAVLLTATALNSFQLEGKEATRVADLLAASSKESQGSIVDVGLSLQQSAAAANQAGVSVEDTIALLTQLGRAGLRGSDAGTSLRVAFLRLINPTKKAREELERLGVTIRDEAGNIRPEVFAEITDELNKLTKAQGDAALATIFGQDAFRAAAIIGREGTVGLNKMRDATQEQGAAAELASARTQGLAGAFENLKNQASNLGLAIGDAAKGPLTDFVNILAGGVKNINTFVSFLDRLGDGADTAALSFEDLQAAAAIRELKGDKAAIEFLKRIQSAAGVTAEEYLKLIIRAGELNRAVAERDKVRVTDDFRQVTEAAGTAGEGLRSKTDEVTTALEAEAGAALTARDSIEAYRSSLTEAARDREAFVQAITPPEGFLPATAAPEVPPPPGVGPTTKLEGAEAVAQARGDLQEALRIQEIQAENARKAFENSKGTLKQREAQFAAMRQAEAKVIATRKQIAAEREAANKEAAAAEEKSFLAGLEGARARQQNQVAIAAQTEGAKDDIRENKELQALIQTQIRQIRASSLSQDAKRQAIQALTAASIATTGTIKGLRQTQQEQLAAARQEGLDAQTALAEAEGNERLQLQLIDIQIRGINQRIARGEVLGAELNRLKAQRATLRAQRDQIVADQQAETAENAALRTQIAEARGADDDVIVAFIDKEIAIAKKAVARAKVANKGVLAAQLELERLREKKREILEQEDKDTTGGTTLVDLFNRAQDIASGAGNVGFTGAGLRDISANREIKTIVQHKLDITRDPAAARAAQQKQSTDNLITAIDRLTEAITGGNSTTGGPLTRRQQNQWRGLTEEQRFYYQKQAKLMVEQGLMG